MIKSMTGFGRGEAGGAEMSVVAEIRTVNNRYFDLSVRTPRAYSFAEEHLRSLVKRYVARGKTELNVNIQTEGKPNTDIVFNEDVARKYKEGFAKIKDMLGIDAEPDLVGFARMPEVFEIVGTPADEEKTLSLICEAARAACERLELMRADEGAKLAADMEERTKHISEIVAAIAARSDEIAGSHAGRLRERISELIGGAAEIPEDRIVLEAAIFADKSSIEEEVVRLESHIAQLGEILRAGSGAVGKKMDFIIQEMNREANTIGSKGNDLEITNMVLELKSEIENVREQVQNVE